MPAFIYFAPMQDNIFIRKATTADRAIIAGISRSTFYDTFASFNTKENMDIFMERQFSADKLEAEVGEPDLIFFLAYCNDELAGYVKLRNPSAGSEDNSIHEIEIARIYSTKSAIGRGIGKALMLRCIEEATALGKTHIWLGVWEKNQRAIDFYTKFGFVKTGEHAFVLGKDIQTDWIMKKKIG